jgi:hypothetical protein
MSWWVETRQNVKTDRAIGQWSNDCDASYLPRSVSSDPLSGSPAFAVRDAAASLHASSTWQK